MSQIQVLLVAVDLGTTATTASHVRVIESYDAQGHVIRENNGDVIEVDDWPGGEVGEAIGKVCLPTELLYHRDTRRLVYWGFGVQRYFDNFEPDIPRTDVYLVEHIKLLLFDRDEVQLPATPSLKLRAERDILMKTLRKDSYEVFEDYMNEVIQHVIKSAQGNYENIDCQKVELILAFPSGWHDEIHTKVAGIGKRALGKAILACGIQDISSRIENVYTVSEIMCGVKQWLHNTLNHRSVTTNLEKLNEGDCFLAVDIGGGTACMVPLQLVGKIPIEVDQLGPTQSLECSGEAVDAKFKDLLDSKLNGETYLDVQNTVNRIYRKFKEEKKNCGHRLLAGTTWNIAVTGLKINRSKGFYRGCLKIPWPEIERECFDPVISILQSAILDKLQKVPAIKVIVFLGQFGGRSAYLQEKLTRIDFGDTKLRYSKSGKVDVVKGAIAERSLSSSFVRKFKAIKSYGTLVTLPYSSGSAAQKMFPNLTSEHAVSFERDFDGLRLKVIEWAIPKGTIVEGRYNCDIGNRHHTWPLSEEVIGFEDVIIISDETPPDPQYEGKSYTLWTEAHEQNELFINNQRMHIQQIPFSWDLTMSQMIDENGKLVGRYYKEDLETVSWETVVKRKRKRSTKLRKLPYKLLWHITEMQVKVSVQALFSKQVGYPVFQLAKERRLDSNEKVFFGESRSKALVADIEVTAAPQNEENRGVDHLASDRNDAPELEIDW